MYSHHHNLTHRHVSLSPSTNSELLDSIQTGNIDIANPYLLTADTQTAGRGQHNRTWQSPKGNVYLSLYHPLSVPLSGLLSLVVGYYITQLPIIKKLNDCRSGLNLPIIAVKWANDIGFYDSQTSNNSNDDRNQNTTTNHTANSTNSNKKILFNKLAGILIEPVTIENNMVGTVIGIGLNVFDAPILNTTTTEGMDYKAISLSNILKQTEIAQARHTNKNANTSANIDLEIATPNALLSTHLTPKDLYLEMAHQIQQAITCFSTLQTAPYYLDNFLNRYAKVNALKGHKLQIRQQDFSQPPAHHNSIENTKQRFKILEGVVDGINADGSLRLRSTNTSNEGTILYIYTGMITAVSAS